MDASQVQESIKACIQFLKEKGFTPVEAAVILQEASHYINHQLKITNVHIETENQELH